MAVQINERDQGKLLEVHVSGRLTAEDYKHFVPECERLIQEHGKIRVLFDMADFHGWNASALWEDIKFDARHFSDIERLAVVGETKWEEWMTKFCRPFTTAKIRYFDRAQAGEAQSWVAAN